MDFLKEHLGDELYGQMTEKLKDSKIKLADLSGGAYVARDKFDSLKTAHDDLAAQLADANKQIGDFTAMDIEGIKTAAAEWKTKYENAQTEAAAKIADMEYSSALRDALSGEKFSSAYAREGIMSEIRQKKLPLENGQIMGLADAIKAIRETQPDAFAQDQKNAPPPGALYGGSAGQRHTAGAVDLMQSAYKEAAKSRNTAEMSRLTREASEKGINLT